MKNRETKIGKDKMQYSHLISHRNAFSGRKKKSDFFSDELSSSSHLLGIAVSTQQCEKKVRLGMSPTSEISPMSCLSLTSVSFLT